MPKEDPQDPDIATIKSRNKFKKIQFSAGDHRLLANLYLPNRPQDEIEGVLFVHGGGTRGKSTFKSVQRQLLGQRIGSLAYDSSGFGGSEGDRTQETLDTRLKDADAAFEVMAQYTNPEMISIVGVSMGADIAIRLLGRKKVSRLILLSPATYPESDRDDPVNLGFTRRLRRNIQGWQNAPGFDQLESFQGQAMIAYGSNDNIIPPQMQERFRAIAQARDWFFLMLEGAPHNLLRPHNDVEREARKSLMSSVSDFLRA